MLFRFPSFPPMIPTSGRFHGHLPSPKWGTLRVKGLLPDLGGEVSRDGARKVLEREPFYFDLRNQNRIIVRATDNAGNDMKMLNQNSNSKTHFWLAFAIITLCLSLPAFAQEEESSVGFIQAAEGPVTVQRGAGTVAAVEGTPLQEGDKVQVGTGAKARVSFEDENTADLGENSELEITTYNSEPQGESVLLKLWQGAVDLLINKKYDGEKSTFHLQTKSAVTGVRGTEYSVEYAADTDETLVSVTEGEVELGRELSERKIRDGEFVRRGFAGRMGRGLRRPMLEKFDAQKLQERRLRRRAKLEARHDQIKQQFKQKYRNRMQNRQERRQNFGPRNRPQGEPRSFRPNGPQSQRGRRQ